MDKLLEKLATVLRDNFTEWELDKLFEMSTGTLIEVLESMPAPEQDPDDD